MGQCSFQLHKNPDNPDALQQVWNWNVLLNGRNVKLLYALFSLFSYIFFVYLFFFCQLSVIDPIRREITEARNAVNMGDYSRAIELLGRAIEVP